VQTNKHQAPGSLFVQKRDVHDTIHRAEQGFCFMFSGVHAPYDTALEGDEKHLPIVPLVHRHTYLYLIGKGEFTRILVDGKT
jgi:hypothetical protein